MLLESSVEFRVEKEEGKTEDEKEVLEHIGVQLVNPGKK